MNTDSITAIAIIVIVSAIGLGIGIFLSSLFRRFYEPLLTVAGSFILASVVLHFNHQWQGAHGEMVGWGLLVGIFLQITIEQLTGGIEHGHITDVPIKYGTYFMIGLVMHALVEAMPISSLYEYSMWYNPIISSIILHRLPASMVFGFIVGRRKKQAFIIWGSLFLLTAPVGAFLGYYVVSDQLLKWFEFVALGSLLYIGSTMVHEQISHHNIGWKQMVILLLGVLLAIGIYYLNH